MRASLSLSTQALFVFFSEGFFFHPAYIHRTARASASIPTSKGSPHNRSDFMRLLKFILGMLYFRYKVALLTIINASLTLDLSDSMNLFSCTLSNKKCRLLVYLIFERWTLVGDLGNGR